MLVAKIKGELFSLVKSYSKEELLALRKNNTFLCPQCNEELQLKVGKIKIPHFAHFPNSECKSLFSERESFNHLLGKQHLYKFFKEKHLNVQLEPFINSLRQRPDILVETKGNQFAIEFQCSKIDSKIWRDRTNGYISRGIKPCWILNTPIKYEKLHHSIQHISLNEFEQQFILQKNHHHYLVTFHPKLKTFFYFSSLIHIKNQQFIAKIQQVPLDYQTFPFLQPKFISFADFQIMLNIYKAKTKTFVWQQLHFSKNGVKNLLLRSIYELRLNRDNLPYIIGIPTLHAYTLKRIAIEWQVSLFYFCMVRKQTIYELTERDVRTFLMVINCDVNSLTVKAVFSYISFLKSLQFSSLQEEISDFHVIKKLYYQLVAI